ncbi:MAG: hypothetical protein ACYCSI_12095 [Solirubrobacteraceae bacterium]
MSVHEGDIPSLKPGQAPPHELLLHGPFGVAMERCDGVNVGKSTIGVVSRPYSRDAAPGGSSGAQQAGPFEQLQSEVYMFKTSGVAMKELATLSSNRGLRCLKQRYQNWTVKGFEGPKSGEARIVRDVKVVGLPKGSLGASVLGWRMTGRPTARGLPEYQYKYQLSQDGLGFVTGRVLVLLDDWGYNGHQFPSASERRLMELLQKRAGGRRL